MRDPDRIDPLLDKLKEVWKRHPDLRLGQLIVVLAKPTEPCPGVFYIEDDVLTERLSKRLLPMEYNVCKTCRASDGRCGLLIDGECLNCHKTRETGDVHIDMSLPRTSEELNRTMEIL